MSTKSFSRRPLIDLYLFLFVLKIVSTLPLQRIEMNFLCMIFAVMRATYVVARERPEWDSNPDLCNAGAVLHQLSCQAKWELV